MTSVKEALERIKTGGLSLGEMFTLLRETNHDYRVTEAIKPHIKWDTLKTPEKVFLIEESQNPDIAMTGVADIIPGELFPEQMLSLLRLLPAKYLFAVGIVQSGKLSEAQMQEVIDICGRNNPQTEILIQAVENELESRAHPR